MAKKDNKCKSNPDSACCHVRQDPVNGKVNYYYPLEITESNKELVETYALEHGLEICWTHYGDRKIWAAMIPCQNTVMNHGLESFVETTSAEQHQIYNKLTRPDLAEQDREKHDGRCQIPNGKGGTRRCPLREENPDYVPGSKGRSTRFKTRVASCSGCPYEEAKYAHTFVPLSALEHVDEDGVVIPFEPASGPDISSGYCFEKWGKDFVEFVRKTNPKLAPEAELLMLEYKKSEISRELGLPSSTVTSRADKLKELFKEFWETIVRP